MHHEYAAITTVVVGLPEDAFELPTRCSGWNVKDLLYHLSRDARRACIALASPVKGRPDVDAISYWRVRPRIQAVRSPYATGAEVRMVWEALSEVAALAAGAASPETLVTRQGHILTAADFLATLVTEATIHGLDLAAALHDARGPARAGWRSHAPPWSGCSVESRRRYSAGTTSPSSSRARAAHR